MDVLSLNPQRFVNAEDAVTATEYAVLIALIVLVAIGAISGIGVSVMNVFVNLRGGVEAATPL